MADPIDVLTLAEAKGALNLDTEAANHDTQLARVITAMSGRLDELVGPVVQRTITDEVIDTGCSGDVWVRRWPVTSWTSVIEYDDAGNSTTLTEETYDTKPTDAFLPERSATPTAPYNGHLHRRESGSPHEFAQTLVVTYLAGRFPVVGDVDARFKEAAIVSLQNWWRSRQLSIAPLDQPEGFDVPFATFPRFAVAHAVKDLLADEVQRR